MFLGSLLTSMSINSRVERTIDRDADKGGARLYLKSDLRNYFETEDYSKVSIVLTRFNKNNGHRNLSVCKKS